MMKRRTFLGGMLAAPVVITTPKLLMPVRSIELPTTPFADALFKNTELVTADIKAHMELSYLKQLAADSKKQQEWWTWRT